MKGVRILVAAGIIAGIVWLYLRVEIPFGIFQLSVDGLPQPDIESSLVLFKDRQIIQAFPLQRIETGWSGILTAWPFVLFGLLLGVLLGFPLGELARRIFAMDGESAKDPRKSKGITLDELIKESNAENKDRQINNLFGETQQLKKEVARLLEKVFDMHKSAKEQNQSMEKLRQEAESAKNELKKAKGKIRRLTGKGRPPRGKSIDGNS